MDITTALAVTQAHCAPKAEILLVAQCDIDRRANKRYWIDQDTGKIESNDYDAGTDFLYGEMPVIGIRDFHSKLGRLQSEPRKFVIRGVPHHDGARVKSKSTGMIGQRGNRKLARKHGEGGAIIDVARRLHMLDFDNVELTFGLDILDTPEEAVRWVIANRLPPEFQAATFVCQFSSSAALKAGPTIFKAHIWFWSSEPYTSAQMKDWGKWWNRTKGDAKLVDHSVFVESQPHYCAAPELIGIADPFPDGRRTILLPGASESVALAMPDEAQQATAESAHRERAQKTAKANGIKGEVAIENDAVRFGSGYAGFLAGIGYADNVRGQIKSAVASYFAIHGAKADRQIIEDRVAAAIDASPHLDQPNGRTRDYARGYLVARSGSLSNVQEMIRDFAAMQAAAEAKPQTVAPTYPDNGVRLAEGERLAREALAGFMRKVMTPAFAVPVETMDESLAAFLDAFPPEPVAPVMVLKMTLGTGKTHNAIQMLNDFPTTECINFLAPDHSLGGELVNRLRANTKHRVLQVLGRDQDDPETGESMCVEKELARQVQGLGLPVQSCLCALKKDDATTEYCHNHPEAGGSCRYQLQIADQGPGIRVAPHSYMALSAEFSPLPKAALTIIDENPTNALVRGTDAKYCIELADILATGAIVENEADRLKTEAEIAAYSASLFAILSHKNPTPAKLRAAGLSASAAKFTSGKWYATLERLDVTPAMPQSAKKDRIAAYRQQIALKLGRLWRIIADVIDSPLDELRPIRVEERLDREGKPRTYVDMVWSFDPKIDGPTLILDGTADEEIMRRFWPSLDFVQIDVKVENYHAIQVTDRMVSKTMIAYDLNTKTDKKDPAEELRSKNNRAKLARICEVYAAGAGKGSVLFTHKAVAEAMRKEHPGLAAAGVEIGFERAPGKWSGHYGAITGQDRWRDHDVAILAGATLPNVAGLESTARAIFYTDPRPVRYIVEGMLPRRQAGLRLADGTGYPVQVFHHPDPIINRVLGQITSASLEQIIHRLRPVRRASDDKPLLIIATNVPLPLTIHAVTTWDDLTASADAAELLLARGVIPDSWTGKALVVADVLAGAADPANALQQWFADRPAAADKIKSAICGECLSPPYIDVPIGGRQTFGGYRYRIFNRRKGDTISVSTRHPDPRLAAEQWLGQLDRWESLTQYPLDINPSAEVRRVVPFNFGRFVGTIQGTPAIFDILAEIMAA